MTARDSETGRTWRPTTRRTRRWSTTRVWIHGGLLLFLLTACARPPSLDSDRAELLRLHETVLQAHRDGDPAPWMAVEADDFVSVDRGAVSFPERNERLAARASWLARATFDSYRDLRDPIVRVSGDATLGWVVAEVEVVGRVAGEQGETAISDVWAWVELYEKREGRWVMVGNASSSRPGPAS